MKLPSEMTCIFLPAVGHASIARNHFIFPDIELNISKNLSFHIAKKQPCQSHPVTVISEGGIFVKYAN